ncbi:MAG: hypothetical protein R3E86_19930 [Pseudomonadales bacterium]
MNWLDGAYGTEMAVLALIALLAASLAVSAIAWWRMRRSAAELVRLQQDLAVFAEASTRVADTLDQVLRDSGKLSEARATGASRRYLLAQAREALEQGEALNLVAARLRLSRDEVQLLRLASSAAAAA